MPKITAHGGASNAAGQPPAEAETPAAGPAAATGPAQDETPPPAADGDVIGLPETPAPRARRKPSAKTSE